MVGRGEPMEAALRVALDRHGMSVEVTPAMQAVEAVMTRAPDLVLLIGDAANEGSVGLLRHLAENPVTSVVPVALLSNDNALDQRMRAFRSGAVAVIQKSASADAVARRIVQLARELPERAGEAAGELGDTTLEELMTWVTSELRSGILSVETKDAQGKPVPMRLVLGSGGQVSEALTDFVKRIKPLVSKAEPVRYELLEATGGRLGLLEDDQAEPGDLDVFKGIRILLMDNDPGRADVLAQALREHGATVALTDPSVPGLERARSLDPDVVLFDSAAIDGPGFEAVRELRRDPRLRWAGLLVVRWEELWPRTAASPDLPQLASRVMPLVQHERSLAERAAAVEAFDTRLELTGPARLLRTLARMVGTRHVIVRNPKATVELDLADGLIVGAQGTRHGEAPLPLNGTVAISALLALSAGRVRVERRGHPSVANVMTPVDEALHMASNERSVVAPTLPPSDGMMIPSEEMDDDEQSSPALKPVKPDAMPSASAVRAANIPKPAAQTLVGVGTGPKAPSAAEMSWAAPPSSAPVPTPATRSRTAYGVGSVGGSAMPPKPVPKVPPAAVAEKASSSAFGTAGQKKPSARTMMGVGGAGAFSSAQSGLRAPGQGSTDETRPKPPDGVAIGRVGSGSQPQLPKVTKKATMVGLGFGDEPQAAPTPPKPPKPMIPPSAPPVPASEDEDASERTVVGDSLAHVRAALAEEHGSGRTTPVAGEDAATADTLRPAAGAMLGMASSASKASARHADATVPIGVPVPMSEDRAQRPSVPAPGGTWSDRPGARRASQPPPASATGAFGDAARTSAPPEPSSTATTSPYVVPLAPKPPSFMNETLRVPPQPMTSPAPQAQPSQGAPVAYPTPVVPMSPMLGAAKPATSSDEGNTVGTGEHTLIIPRDKAITPGGGRKTAVIVATGLAFVTFAAVLGVLVSRLVIDRNKQTARPAQTAQTTSTAPAQPATTAAPTTVATAQPATTSAQPTAPTQPNAPDATVTSVVDAGTTQPVDAGITQAAPSPQLAAAPAPAPSPAPTATDTDLSGITPDARLPRDDADASDVLVEDALRLLAEGKLGAARVALERAVTRDRINPQAYEAFARYHLAARTYPQAIEMAQRAVELRRRQGRYYAVLGDAYLAAGDRAKAREAWTAGVAADRDRTCRERLAANP